MSLCCYIYHAGSSERFGEAAVVVFDKTAVPSQEAKPEEAPAEEAKSEEAASEEPAEEKAE